MALIGLLWVSAPALADRSTVPLPESLSVWREWVLYGQERLFCPCLYQHAADCQCLWPEVLILDFQATGGRFRQICKSGRFP